MMTDSMLLSNKGLYNLNDIEADLKSKSKNLAQLDLSNNFLE
jgi:hypothetical protein